MNSSKHPFQPPPSGVYNSALFSPAKATVQAIQRARQAHEKLRAAVDNSRQWNDPRLLRAGFVRHGRPDRAPGSSAARSGLPDDGAATHRPATDMPPTRTLLVFTEVKKKLVVDVRDKDDFVPQDDPRLLRAGRRPQAHGRTRHDRGDPPWEDGAVRRRVDLERGARERTPPLTGRSLCRRRTPSRSANVATTGLWSDDRVSTEP